MLAGVCRDSFQLFIVRSIFLVASRLTAGRKLSNSFPEQLGARAV